MKKDDYIFYLNKALKGELPPEKVKYYTDYYKQYIDEEVRNGRKQQDVIDELGHPNMIAKSVIEAEKMSGGVNGHYEDVEEHEHIQDVNFKYFKIKSIAIGILLLLSILIVISLVMGAFIILLRIFFPIILIVGIIVLIKKMLR